MVDAKKILIAEDNPVLAAVLQRNLQRCGYQTKVANDGWEAIESLKTQPVDLLLTDFQLPGATGGDICRFVRQERNDPDLPILICTAKSVELLQQSESVQQWHPTALISKPFSMRAIIQKIESAFAETLSCR